MGAAHYLLAGRINVRHAYDAVQYGAPCTIVQRINQLSAKTRPSGLSAHSTCVRLATGPPAQLATRRIV